MKKLYDKVSLKASKLVTNSYSTSFSLGIKSLHKDFHDPIYAIYGFVRLADEIVDSFEGYDQETLIIDFEKDTFDSIESGISLNPILHSFQSVVNQYSIDHKLIRQFLVSMKMDLDKKTYNKEEYDLYILGSAEVVGLMCLAVFCEGDKKLYESLYERARSLGSAFQKINFLRDIKTDCYDLKRMYFPGLDVESFDNEAKKQIEDEIELEFQNGLEGIKELPKKAQLGTYLAFVYFYSLFKKIRRSNAQKILNERVRIPDAQKYLLFCKSYFKYKIGHVS